MPDSAPDTRPGRAGTRGRPGAPLIFCILLSLVALLTPVASGAQSPSDTTHSRDWSAIVDAARKEGKVVLYTNTVPPVNERLKSEFEAANSGIKLEFVRIVGPAVTTKVIQERQLGFDGGDVVISSEVPFFVDGVKSGLFAMPPGPASKDWPKDYLIGREAAVIGVEPFVIVYNTDLVKSKISGYQDLLRPELMGRIGASELASPALVAWYEWLDNTQGNNFVTKFAAQQPRLYVGATPSTQATASGEVAVAPFSIMSIAQPLITNGAHLEIVVPKPSLGNAYGAGIVQWAHRPNAAQVFLDFVLSKAGQTLLSGRGEMASPLGNIPGSLDAKAIAPYESAKYTPDVVKAYEEKWNKLFKAGR